MPPVVPTYAPQGQESPDIIAPAPRLQDYPQDDEYGRMPQSGPALPFVATPSPVRQVSDQSQMPGPGFIPGQVNLNPQIAPPVPPGAPRPLAPGEWVDNPRGGWSSEETTTVQAPNGKFVNIPTLWLKDGKPYVAASPEEALQLSQQSGLSFRSYATAQEADRAAQQREIRWNQMGDPATWGNTNPAQAIPPLWEQPQQNTVDWRTLLNQVLTNSGIVAALRGKS